MEQFLLQHVIHWAIAGGLSLVLSAAARALPEPVPNGSRLYLFFYRFVQGIMANPDLKAKASLL